MPSRMVGSLLFTLGLLLVGGPLGCRAGSSDRTGPIKIGYFANLTHAQAVLGVASGDFERTIAPAKLEAKVFNAGPSLVEALFAGEIDIGYVGPGPALSAHQKPRRNGLPPLPAPPPQ